MNKVSKYPIALIAFLLSPVLLALDGEQLDSLKSAVKEMCETPTQSGERFSVEGKAAGNVLIKLIGIGLEGEISKSEWDGIEQYRETQANRLECVVSLTTLLLPNLKESTEHDSIPEEDWESVQKITLRASPISVSNLDVIRMIYEKGFHHPGDLSRVDLSSSVKGSFANAYEVKEISGERVIVDHATGLMWQSSGSFNNLTWEQSIEHALQSNSNKYAGYRDWRIPTIEELASLIEYEPKSYGALGEMYISNNFDSGITWSWSSDPVLGKPRVWGIYLPGGIINSNGAKDTAKVRLVRTVK